MRACVRAGARGRGGLEGSYVDPRPPRRRLGGAVMPPGRPSVSPVRRQRRPAARRKRRCPRGRSQGSSPRPGEGHRETARSSVESDPPRRTRLHRPVARRSPRGAAPPGPERVHLTAMPPGGARCGAGPDDPPLVGQPATKGVRVGFGSHELRQCRGVEIPNDHVSVRLPVAKRGLLRPADPHREEGLRRDRPGRHRANVRGRVRSAPRP